MSTLPMIDDVMTATASNLKASTTSHSVDIQVRRTPRKAAHLALEQISTLVEHEDNSNDSGSSECERSNDNVAINRDTQQPSASDTSDAKKRKLTPGKAPVAVSATASWILAAVTRHCKCCDTDYKSRDEFMCHVVVVMGPTSSFVMFKCPDCCHCVDSMNALDKHRTKEHNYRPPKPPHSSPPRPPSTHTVLKPMPPKDKLKNAKSVKLECPICTETFYDPAQLSTHLDAHNFLSNLNVGSCITSSNSHKTTSPELHNHEATSHQQKPLRKSRNTNMVERSEVNSMRLSQGSYACRWCSSKYKTRSAFRKHLLTCRKGSPSLACDQCGRGFSNAETLKRHLLLHAGIRPFKCTECEKAYTSQQHLTVSDYIKPLGIAQSG